MTTTPPRATGTEKNLENRTKEGDKNCFIFLSVFNPLHPIIAYEVQDVYLVPYQASMDVEKNHASIFISLSLLT